MTPLSLAHAALIAGMHHVCFKEPWDAKAMAELLALPGSYGFLAGADRPEGFVLCRAAAGEAEVLTLLVLPPYRRAGLGARLLEAAAAGAGARGAEALFLEVAADNTAGQALYAAGGFHQVGRRPHYYGGVTDALVLRKDLGAAYSS
ncbi:ribosomal-protein-alanine N-acetyltransferase [mine drainage metagenome]|uniref:Ribosomal-protein-alanine N-acetyltransferase n=1 Tax=mine drainage metagenome TaxID=410659 RepID=A0A1J5SKW1_9ZZZZ